MIAASGPRGLTSTSLNRYRLHGTNASDFMTSSILGSVFAETFNPIGNSIMHSGLRNGRSAVPVSINARHVLSSRSRITSVNIEGSMFEVVVEYRSRVQRPSRAVPDLLESYLDLGVGAPFQSPKESRAAGIKTAISGHSRRARCFSNLGFSPAPIQFELNAPMPSISRWDSQALLQQLTMNSTMLWRIRLVLRTFHSSYRRNYASSSAAADSPIKVQYRDAPHSGQIRILLLDRPEARNALSRRLISDLRKHITEIQAEKGTGSTRALILASNTDKAFCAGADLRERKGMTQEETRDFLTTMRNTFTDLSNLPIPTISAISSVALGGGLEIALCTTLRVFATSAIVGQPETKLAIIPGAGGTYRLPALIGVNKARDLILTGRRVGGTEAYFLGLCNRLVEATPAEQKEEGKARQKVLDASIQLANDICEGGPIALTQAMRAINGWQRGEVAENEAYEVILHTEDRVEALKAFAEKRKPVFKGR
ncbi:hypothetical protein LTR47_000335 [Exophiala xenobiotica]|nr:hypothetical protein LTR47_000335 [Exophiala xenobiotica]KAK5258160.1 hypothetical protein LTR40_008458 [Exophiala xenobiotica]KAK5325495.1 hypothetical protein LTR93_003715 [Exophiala xenobiotica]KAK5349684.1 hypothetical protein LTR61_006390 [Exophiala xenobiotica]KAK5387399.1 hypothetical protein LTR11_001064 [Exophiala xenobiotica]